MQYIILAAILLLLLVVILKEGKEKENWFWAKIVVLYLLLLLSLDIGVVRLPLGIILAYFFIRKYGKLNLSIKRLTLLFAFVGFMLIHYVIPSVEINQVLYEREIHNQMDRFEKIEYVKVFKPDASIQEEIKEYLAVPDIMFRTYMLKENNIPIKSEEWLLMQSYQELDHYWMSETIKSKETKLSKTSARVDGVVWQEYIKDNKNGDEYIGIFQRGEDGEIYLKYVIKGKLHNADVPQSLF